MTRFAAASLALLSLVIATQAARAGRHYQRDAQRDTDTTKQLQQANGALAALRTVCPPPESASKHVKAACAAVEVFAEHHHKFLVAGAYASQVFPHPILMIAGLLKSVTEASADASDSLRDLYGDLFEEMATIPDENAQLCSECGSNKHCKQTCLQEGARASGEQELKRQYELFSSLRESCTSPEAVQEVFRKAREITPHTDKGSTSLMENDEPNHCVSMRDRLKKGLEELHGWMLAYQKALHLNSGDVLSRPFVREIHAFLGNEMEPLLAAQCRRHSDCSKYQFCTTNMRCRDRESCTDAKALDGACPERQVPTNASLLCENGDLEGGCCWSTCSLVSPLRSCGKTGTVPLRLSKATAHPPWHVAQKAASTTCSKKFPEEFNHAVLPLTHNLRSECCHPPRKREAAANIGAPGASHWCCPNNDCNKLEQDGSDFVSDNVEEGDDEDEAFIQVMEEDKKAQEADSSFRTVPPMDEDPDNVFEMLARRVAVIDLQLKDMQNQCNSSIAHIFHDSDIIAAEAARCIEGGSHLKTAMARWASMKVMQHVLPAQARWATVACPAIVSAMQEKVLKMEAEKEELPKLQQNILLAEVAHLYVRWENECQEFVDISLTGIMDTMPQFETVPESISNQAELLIVGPKDVYRTGVNKKAVATLSKLESSMPGIMTLGFDAASYYSIMQGATEAGVGEFAESAAWLAKRGNEIYHHSKWFAAGRLESFCIAAAYKLEGIGRELAH